MTHWQAISKAQAKRIKTCWFGVALLPSCNSYCKAVSRSYLPLARIMLVMVRYLSHLHIIVCLTTEMPQCLHVYVVFALFFIVFSFICWKSWKGLQSNPVQPMQSVCHLLHLFHAIFLSLFIGSVFPFVSATCSREHTFSNLPCRTENPAPALEQQDTSGGCCHKNFQQFDFDKPLPSISSFFISMPQQGVMKEFSEGFHGKFILSFLQ